MIEDEFPEEEEFEEVPVDFAKKWSVEDRMRLLIEGARSSADEIIKSLHQPINLVKLKDEKYKSATEGRTFAIESVSNLLAKIEALESRLEEIKKPEDERVEKVSSFSESRAKD